jgi:hypothetical protein
MVRDKAASFTKLCGKRTAQIVKEVNTFGNLSNPYNYAFTKEAVDKAFAEIKAAVADAEARFAKGLRDQPLVGTGRRKQTAVAETTPVQKRSEEPSGSSELAETTVSLVDEASKQAQREEMERIEKEDVPAFLKKKA